MNKAIPAGALFVAAISLIVPFALTAHAARTTDPVTGSVLVASITNLGFSKTRTIELLGSGAVRINGIKMNDVHRIAVQPSLIELFRAPKETPEALPCAAGKFIYRRTVGPKITWGKGCLESQEFARIASALQAL